MYCKNCGSPMQENEQRCTSCGAPAARSFTEADLPAEYRPLSPWSYFWLQVLYAIPVVGFIFLIIFSFKKDNINRRNFTRSYWCSLVLALIIGLIVLIIAAAAGAGIYSSFN